MCWILKKKKQIQPIFQKTTQTPRKQAILLMTLKYDSIIFHKKVSLLLRGITSKHHGDFYYLNCLHSFATKNTLNHISKYVKINIFIIF